MLSNRELREEESKRKESIRVDTIFPAAGLETVDLTGGAPLPTGEEVRRRPFVGVWSPDGAPLSAEAKNLSFVITASETAEPHLTSGSEAEKLVISVPNVDETLRLLERVNKVNPVAVAVLHQVLVAGEDMTLDAAFTLESLAYSALLGGAEFQTWLATQGSPSVVDEVCSGAVSVDSSPDGGALLVTLDRPQRKNAFGRVMRAELLDTLRVLDHAPSLRAEIRGAGTVF